MKLVLIATLSLACSVAVLAARPQPDTPKKAPRSADWNAEKAAHLLSRAGFGGTPDQVRFMVKLGRPAAVNYLLDYEKVPYSPARPTMSDPEAAIDMRAKYRGMAEEDRKKIRQEIQALQQISTREMSNWWLSQMVATPRPLQEKMTLFWHGHFTSGIREVKRAHMLFEQNELFRSMAVGNYREMLVAVSRDPAMLIYLNNAQNRRQHPNENYARELMELFTLGIGHYSEQDVKEAARAFTGWTINPQTAEYVFAGRMHDYGEKKFLGQQGEFDGADIIDIILQQPAAAEYLVKRLWTYFAGSEIPQAELRRLASTFRSSNYELKPLLRALFTGDAFYAPDVLHCHVKSPVELIVGTLRALEVTPQDTTAFVAASRLMGQELFQPPNVKGWDGGLTWINTASLFNRYNLLGYVVYGTPKRPPAIERRIMQTEERVRDLDPELGQMAAQMVDASELMTNQKPYDPLPILHAAKLRSPEQIVDHFVDRLLQRPIESQRRAVLIAEFKRVGGPLALDSRDTTDATRGLIHLIMSMPEYQLN